MLTNFYACENVSINIFIYIQRMWLSITICSWFGHLKCCSCAGWFAHGQTVCSCAESCWLQPFVQNNFAWGPPRIFKVRLSYHNLSNCFTLIWPGNTVAAVDLGSTQAWAGPFQEFQFDRSFQTILGVDPSHCRPKLSDRSIQFPSFPKNWGCYEVQNVEQGHFLCCIHFIFLHIRL